MQSQDVQEHHRLPVYQAVSAAYVQEDFEDPVPLPSIQSSVSLSAPTGAQSVACVYQRRATLAYLKDDKGKISPVRDTLDIYKDEDWIDLKFTDFDGPRIRLGVLKVINKTAEPKRQNSDERIEVPVAGIQEMLNVALYHTRRFDVIEQKRVQEVQAQQRRRDVEEPSPTSIVNIGKVLGAQYLVYGTVNEWSPDRAGRNIGPGGIFNATKHGAEVAITFTLTDVGTGQILFTTSERARMGEWDLGSGAPDGGGGTTQQNTPAGYAVRACANKAAYKMANFLKNRKWRGSVVEIKKTGIYINAGSQQGMTPHTSLSVQAVMGIVRDQESGTILGEDLSSIGTLKVVAVQQGFSIAEIEGGCKGLKVGDRVELTPGSECEAMEASLAR
jgi:curli biogenesis system outer membrane secretion channel CsgG